MNEAAEPKIIVVDLETTTLDANKGSILQFGAVWLSGGEGEFEMDCRMWDGAVIDPKSLEINGLSQERCCNPALPTEGEVIAEFLRWLGPQPVMLAGINPSFDRAFLHAAMRRAAGGRNVHKTELFPHRQLDLHSLTVSYAIAKGEPVPSRGFYTDEIYAVLDLDPEPKPHVAIVGARKEAEALRILLNLPEATEPLPYEVVAQTCPHCQCVQPADHAKCDECAVDLQPAP